MLINLSSKKRKVRFYVTSKQLEFGFNPSPGIFGTVCIIEFGSAVFDRETLILLLLLFPELFELRQVLILTKRFLYALRYWELPTA